MHDKRNEPAAGGVHEYFRRQVHTKGYRKLRARQRSDENVWFGLGMFGLVGWSIAIPTLAGVALGVWLDSRWPGRFSWTLMLLIAGVVLGCMHAWYWMRRQREIIEEEASLDDVDR